MPGASLPTTTSLAEPGPLKVRGNRKPNPPPPPPPRPPRPPLPPVAPGALAAESLELAPGFIATWATVGEAVVEKVALVNAGALPAAAFSEARVGSPKVVTGTGTGGGEA